MLASWWSPRGLLVSWVMVVMVVVVFFRCSGVYDGIIWGFGHSDFKLLSPGIGRLFFSVVRSSLISSGVTVGGYPEEMTISAMSAMLKDPQLPHEGHNGG